jgi:hypothetical protein
MPERVINFDEPQERAKVAAGVQRLRGRWRITLVRYRPRRTDRQNRYYWPCFVIPFAEWLTEEWGEPHTPDDAHIEFKKLFLSKTMTNRHTGEVKVMLRSTTKLTTSEFNEYLDRCADHLAQFCGIVVPSPSEYHEQTKEAVHA